MELNTCIKNVEGFFPEGSLNSLCYEGAQRIYGTRLTEEVVDRLEFEMEVIKKAGAEHLLLIAQDIVNTAKNELGVLVEPGRYAIAGSLVAFCLGITGVDPLKHDLMFESFINPDTPTLYDIIIGFDNEGLESVIKWFEKKYEIKQSVTSEKKSAFYFIGLNHLSKIKAVLAAVKKSEGINIDLKAIPLEDPKTFELFQYGITDGVFCFDSGSMQQWLRYLHPTKFNELVLLNVMFRPGIMDYIPQMLQRKNGKEKIEYPIPEMEEYLRETYGILIYQEQLMLLSRLIASFTRGESDTLQKAFCRRDKDELAAWKPKFLEGGMANGHEKRTLELIWKEWEHKGAFAFNKAHAVCYSWLGYQMAYLKANYPEEFNDITID